MSSKFKVTVGGDGVATLELKRLDPAQVDELLDLLRKNFLYQQPRAVVRQDAPDDTEPEFLMLRMLPGHWRRMMELIKEAGGWELPPEELQRLEAEQAAQIGVLEDHDV